MRLVVFFLLGVLVAHSQNFDKQSSIDGTWKGILTYQDPTNKLRGRPMFTRSQRALESCLK